MDNATLNRLRETKLAPAELVTDSDSGIFSGYASIFGIADLGNDVILPGAFSASLLRRKAGGIRMLYQHDPSSPIGAWTALREDGSGLRVEGRVALQTHKGREVFELMRAGAIDGLSIGFRTVRSRLEPKSGARQILEADLWEISVVTFPMHPDARVEALKGWRWRAAAPWQRQTDSSGLAERLRRAARLMANAAKGNQA
jgi:HK97 family phage prohead protease